MHSGLSTTTNTRPIETTIGALHSFIEPASPAFPTTDITKATAQLSKGLYADSFADTSRCDTILSNFSEGVSSRDSPKDPFLFENFLRGTEAKAPIAEHKPFSPKSFSKPSSSCSSTFSPSRKRSFIDLHDCDISGTDSESCSISSKAIRSNGLKKSPSRYHLANLDTDALESTQDELLTNLAVLPRVTSGVWGQHVDLDSALSF